MRRQSSKRNKGGRDERIDGGAVVGRPLARRAHGLGDGRDERNRTRDRRGFARTRRGGRRHRLDRRRMRGGPCGRLSRIPAGRAGPSSVRRNGGPCGERPRRAVRARLECGRLSAGPHCGHGRRGHFCDLRCQRHWHDPHGPGGCGGAERIWARTRGGDLVDHRQRHGIPGLVALRGDEGRADGLRSLGGDGAGEGRHHDQRGHAGQRRHAGPGRAGRGVHAADGRRGSAWMPW